MVKSATPPYEIAFIGESEITSEKLSDLIREHAGEGITICVRTDAGEDQRGGYVFTYEANERIECRFFPFSDNQKVIFENWEECARFIRHASGIEYDAEMWELCQELNRRTLEENPSG